MYKPVYFTENNEDVIAAFIKEYPFAVLMGVNMQLQPSATQVPLLLVEKQGRKMLIGHVMKKTDHHLSLKQNPSVLALFTGPHTYISASWYNNPQVASTWNYMSVHIRGTIKFVEALRLKRILKITTDFFENDEKSGAAYSAIPDTYINGLVNAIEGFEIEIESTEAVFKLSQNKNDATAISIAGQLIKGNENSKIIAAEMLKRRKL